MTHVKMKFNLQGENLKSGDLQTDDNVSVKIFDGGVRPYELLLGALGSCFYATFISITEKKRLTFGEVSLEISGRKREDVPTTLEEVTMELVITNPSNEQQLLRSAELGAKYCSIHDTIAKVAEIKLNVTFK